MTFDDREAAKRREGFLVLCAQLGDREAFD